MIIKELTEKEKSEAVSFMEWVAQMTYEEFEQWKKENTWWTETLLNWCRIRKDYPELNTIRETRFVLPDKQKKREKNKKNIIAQMSKNKAMFISTNLIDEEEAKDIKFKLIHHDYAWWDEYITLAIPFTWTSLPVCKFGAWIQIYKSQCPELFTDLLTNTWRYDWTPECRSNAERYNKNLY